MYLLGELSFWIEAMSTEFGQWTAPKFVFPLLVCPSHHPRPVGHKALTVNFPRRSAAHRAGVGHAFPLVGNLSLTVWFIGEQVKQVSLQLMLIYIPRGTAGKKSSPCERMWSLCMKTLRKGSPQVGRD